MKAVVTGGAGFIGSHTCVELIARGVEVTILDNLCNSSLQVLDRLQRISGVRPHFVKADVRDSVAVSKALEEFRPDVVLHFGALKSVGESNSAALEYFDNNIGGTLLLLKAMQAAGVKSLVFSSSATVYGDPVRCPVDENAPRSATNPYARTKLVTEDLLTDVCRADPGLRVATLRYFNPVGAHPSGLIGEDPAGLPNNLMPFVCQVAVGRQAKLAIYGNDYPTPDGTGVRDYIHVMDLARAHVDAIETLHRNDRSLTVNVGTGRGYSVLELVKAFETASGRSIPVEFAPRRAGDVASCYADATRARDLMGWQSQFDLDRMCQDAWRWQQSNPDGYK